VAWLVIVMSALMLPISACSALMVAVGSHGTQNTDVLGYVTVVFGPLFALACGFGLLRRKPWGWYGVLALCAIVLATNAYTMATAPTEDVTTIGPDGVRNTRLGGGAEFLWPFVLFPGVLIALLLTPGARRDFSRTE
jgi:hypothetical protein